MNSRAAVLEGPKQIVLREFPLPSITEDDGLIRVEMAGVCGTDYGHYSGSLPAPYPLILGHEILGSIARVGDRAAKRWDVREGDRVLVEGSVPCWSCSACRSGSYKYCPTKQGYGTRTPVTEPPALWGAMSQFMYLAPGSILHKVPTSASAQSAIGAALVANALEWLDNQGSLKIGDNVVIQGCGPQGLAAVAVAREGGAREVIVTGLARDSARLELANRLGATHTVRADSEAVTDRIREITGGAMADLVLDVTGSPGAVTTSIDLCRPQATLVIAGLAGHGTVTPIATDKLVWNEIRLQGVFIKGSDAIERGLTLTLTRGDVYPLHEIVSHVFPLENVEEAIVSVADTSDAQFIKAAIAPAP